MAIMARHLRAARSGKGSRAKSNLSSPPEHVPVTAPPVVEESEQSSPAQPILFEIGWEVCWQLGGIYTVLRSKAPAMLQRWDERYCLIGPYNPQTAAFEFDEQPPTGI